MLSFLKVILHINFLAHLCYSLIVLWHRLIEGFSHTASWQVSFVNFFYAVFQLFSKLQENVACSWFYSSGQTDTVRIFVVHGKMYSSQTSGRVNVFVRSGAIKMFYCCLFMNLPRKINSRLDITSVWIYENLRYLQKFQVRFNILTLEVIKKQLKVAS